MNGNILSDVVFAERRGQSQKPEKIYEMIESLVPNGFNLFEISKYLLLLIKENIWNFLQEEIILEIIGFQ